MALDIAGYAKVLDINCYDYYTRPEAQLYDQMRYHLWEAENLKCNRFFDKVAFISFGAAMDPSFFGAKAVFLQDQAPWIDSQNLLIKEHSDLDRLQEVDIKNGGLGPRVHQFYETMCELTEGTGIKVMYPIVSRSPFSVATELREITALLIDMLEAPEFFHQLMRRITDGLKAHAQQRANYLGEPVAHCKLCNDEVSTPMLAPSMYDEFILPYELELAEFHGRIMYWHSCGVTDEFYKSISKIPHLDMMHIGPWSNVEKAADVFGACDVALDICVSATGDVYDRTPQEMREKLLQIKQACKDKVRYAVRADGFQIVHTVEQDLEKIKQWNDAAIEVFGTA